MDTEVDYAGISKRIIAYIIDANLFKATIFTISCILLIFSVFTTHNLYDYFFSKTAAQDVNDTVEVIYITIGSIVAVTFSILMIVKFSGTPGQLLLGMRVKDKNTLENITVMQAIKRALSFKIFDSIAAVYYFHAWFLILPILIWILILVFAVRDKRKQALHDKIAKTVVINYKPNSIAQESDSVS